ncbi:AbrB family transcriptional regulator [Macrococcoides caseolyticum]|uniref:AbrB family transcriptional regulator n=1 Tax=Macrococcoides caseolyticum TaxID=69966 RepID=UPI0009FDA5CB|nr:AbrB family transcriptional regulator [Macrococcus caseolyticus]
MTFLIKLIDSYFIGVLIQNLLLIIGTFIIVYIMNLFMHESFNDLFLSAAPGGMAQIIIIGLETGANVAMISSYHIFRIFIILLVVTPLLSIYLNYRARHI